MPKKSSNRPAPRSRFKSSLIVGAIYLAISFNILFIAVIYKLLFPDVDPLNSLVGKPVLLKDFSFQVTIFGEFDRGEAKISVLNSMVRTDYKSQDQSMTTISKDGLLYSLTPVPSVNLQRQASLDWQFDSVFDWKFIKNEDFQGKSVRVYEISLMRDGKIVKATLYYDPQIKLPIQVTSANGSGWRMNSFNDKVPLESEFEIPQNFKFNSERTNLDYCPKGKSSNCSKGWTCETACPGGNCC